MKKEEAVVGFCGTQQSRKGKSEGGRESFNVPGRLVRRSRATACQNQVLINRKTGPEQSIRLSLAANGLGGEMVVPT